MSVLEFQHPPPPSSHSPIQLRREVRDRGDLAVKLMGEKDREITELKKNWSVRGDLARKLMGEKDREITELKNFWSVEVEAKAKVDSIAHTDAMVNLQTDHEGALERSVAESAEAGAR